jgi:predicted transposase/invertase (TIGR01784 family)
MKEIHQPHDRFFRSVFSEIDNVRDLLRNSLPPRILQLLDLKSIELADDSFIDERLSLYQSDILIRARMRASPVLIYILVDHKSYPDKWTVFQLLVYMVRIWERELSKNRKLKKLPCIIPVIFYHGNSQWSYPLNFASYVAAFDNDLKAYVPEFHTLMFNLRTVDLESVQSGIVFQLALRAFKHTGKELRSHLREMVVSISQLPVDSKTKAFLSRLFEYILKVGGDFEVTTVEEELRSVGSDISREVLMTLEEQILERGKVAGKIEGTIQGAIQDKQQVLIRLIHKKFGPLDNDNKQRVLDSRDKEKLDSAIDLILDADSVDEVLSPLQ